MAALASGACATPPRYVTLYDVDAHLDAEYGGDPQINAFHCAGARPCAPDRREHRVVWPRLCGAAGLPACVGRVAEYQELIDGITLKLATLLQIRFVLEAAVRGEVKMAAAVPSLRLLNESPALSKSRTNRLQSLTRSLNLQADFATLDDLRRASDAVSVALEHEKAARGHGAAIGAMVEKQTEASGGETTASPPAEATPIDDRCVLVLLGPAGAQVALGGAITPIGADGTLTLRDLPVGPHGVVLSRPGSPAVVTPILLAPQARPCAQAIDLRGLAGGGSPGWTQATRMGAVEVISVPGTPAPEVIAEELKVKVGVQMFRGGESLSDVFDLRPGVLTIVGLWELGVLAVARRPAGP